MGCGYCPPHRPSCWLLDLHHVSWSAVGQVVCIAYPLRVVDASDVWWWKVVTDGGGLLEPCSVDVVESIV